VVGNRWARTSGPGRGLTAHPMDSPPETRHPYRCCRTSDVRWRRSRPSTPACGRQLPGALNSSRSWTRRRSRSTSRTWSAGPRTATGTSAWAGAASGLTAVILQPTAVDPTGRDQSVKCRVWPHHGPEKCRLNRPSSVITGGASGIAAAAARRFAWSGMRVTIIDLNRSAGDALAKELGRGASFHSSDAGDPDAVERVAQVIEREGPPVGVLFTCAGLIANAEPGLDMDLEAPDFVWRVNYLGAVHACRSFGRRTTARRQGTIVTVNSINGFIPLPLPAYNRGKTAVTRLTRLLAVELGCRGIRFNIVGPTYVMTPPLHARGRRPAGRREDDGGACVGPPAGAAGNRRGDVLPVLPRGPRHHRHHAAGGLGLALRRELQRLRRQGDLGREALPAGVTAWLLRGTAAPAGTAACGSSP